MVLTEAVDIGALLSAIVVDMIIVMTFGLLTDSPAFVVVVAECTVVNIIMFLLKYCKSCYDTMYDSHFVEQHIYM